MHVFGSSVHHFAACKPDGLCGGYCDHERCGRPGLSLLSPGLSMEVQRNESGRSLKYFDHADQRSAKSGRQLFRATDKRLWSGGERQCGADSKPGCASRIRRPTAEPKRPFRTCSHVLKRGHRHAALQLPMDQGKCRSSGRNQVRLGRDKCATFGRRHLPGCGYQHRRLGNQRSGGFDRALGSVHPGPAKLLCSSSGRRGELRGVR